MQQQANIFAARAGYLAVRRKYYEARAAKMAATVECLEAARGQMMLELRQATEAADVAGARAAQLQAKVMVRPVVVAPALELPEFPRGAHASRAEDAHEAWLLDRDSAAVLMLKLRSAAAEHHSPLRQPTGGRSKALLSLAVQVRPLLLVLGVWKASTSRLPPPHLPCCKSRQAQVAARVLLLKLEPATPGCFRILAARQLCTSRLNRWWTCTPTTGLQNRTGVDCRAVSFCTHPKAVTAPRCRGSRRCGTTWLS